MLQEDCSVVFVVLSSYPVELCRENVVGVET